MPQTYLTTEELAERIKYTYELFVLDLKIPYSSRAFTTSASLAAGKSSIYGEACLPQYAHCRNPVRRT
jgi:hypothetical protein